MSICEELQAPPQQAEVSVLEAVRFVLDPKSLIEY